MFRFASINIALQNWCDSKWFASFCFLFFAFGSYLSLKVVLGLFGLEPDTGHSLMLWHGVNEHGLIWVKDWLFTQDNWLFSLVPIHFIEFWIAGPKPALVIGTGWAIFVASAVVAGLIAQELNAKKSFYIIPTVLVFMGFYAHFYGFVSYSTSHNITNLLGLLSTLALVKWLKTRHWLLLGIIFLIQLAGGLSDPWLVAAYTLPATLVAVALILKSETPWERKECAWLFVVMASSILLIKSSIFGLLDFLPKIYFSIGSWETINSNAVYFIKDLGGLVNLAPGIRSNFFTSAFISLAVFLGLFIVSARHAITEGISTRSLAFFALTLLSTGGIFLAFLITNSPAADYSARFLINIPYLFAVAIAISFEKNWRRTSTLVRLSMISVASLFIVAGFVSNVDYLKKPGFSIKPSGAHELMTFLSNHGLTYGYGSYWGAEANAITLLSKSKIKVRPVEFDKSSGRLVFGKRFETSKRWYSADDADHNQKTFFVVLSSEDKGCLIVQTCIDELTRWYGEPTKVLSHANSQILVWDHPLFGWAENR